MVKHIRNLWPFKPLIFSTVFLSIGIATALDLGVFDFASAAPSEPPRTIEAPKEPMKKPPPIVFARYTKSEALSIQQSPEERVLCKASTAFRASDKNVPGDKVDLCAPYPSLTTSTQTQAIAKWRLPASPSEFVWQQDVPAGQKLVVELVQSDGLQWPALFSSSELGTKVSIRGIPSYELFPEQEVFLNASLYGADGKRLENWVIAISVEKGSASALPWATKS